MKQHRVGVHEGFLTTHKIGIAGLTPDNTEAIRSEIDAMIGVDGVWLDSRRSTLKIAYDASHHNIDEMIAVLNKYGADVSGSRWKRFKLGWMRQTDLNIKNNAAHEAHCCNKMPTDRH